MKTSILSMQRVQNMGSLLQAYSLKKILEEMGHDVSFIDIQPIEEDDKLFGGERERYGHECAWKQGVLSKIRKIDRYTINRIRIKQRSNKQIKLFEVFRRDYLQIKAGDNERHYDACVIGSDEVFNCNIASRWGFTSQLFGNVKQADKVITYAACCGSTTYEKTPDAVREKISETLKKVSALSVRDENTYDFVSMLAAKEIYSHMDPVVVGDFDDEIESCELPQNLSKRYCIVYSYYNRFHKPDEIKAIKQFSKKENLELVTIGAPQMWIKKHLVVTPFQALKVFQQADFIITDTFHGTIFSVKYAKKIALMTRESNKNKLLDLVKKLGIEKHLMDSLEQLSEVYKLEIDKTKIEKIVGTERKKTMHYLKENL